MQIPQIAWVCKGASMWRTQFHMFLAQWMTSLCNPILFPWSYLPHFKHAKRPLSLSPSYRIRISHCGNLDLSFETNEVSSEGERYKAFTFCSDSLRFKLSWFSSRTLSFWQKINFHTLFLHKMNVLSFSVYPNCCSFPGIEGILLYLLICWRCSITLFGFH